MDIHHILGRGWLGADTEYNLLMVCRLCHEEVERTSAGKVLALYTKMISACLDLQFLSTSVRYDVVGAMDNWAEADPTLREYVEKLKRHPSAGKMLI